MTPRDDAPILTAAVPPPESAGRGTAGGWRVLGPGGGGCVHALTVSPHDADTMLVSCDMTQGFITRDGGRSWRQFNLKSRQYAYAFDPVDPSAFYAGATGLYGTRDAGATWRLLFPDPALVIGETRLMDESMHRYRARDNWPGGSIHGIAIDPRDSRRLFIAIKAQGADQADDFLTGRRRKGILVFGSADSGATWAEFARFPEDRDIGLFAFMPGENGPPRLILASDKGAYLVDALAGSRVEPLALPRDCARARHAAIGLDRWSGTAVMYLIGQGAGQGADGQEPPDDAAPGACLWRSGDAGRTWTRLAVHPRGDRPAPGAILSQVAVCAADARSVWLIAERWPGEDPGAGVPERHGILHSADCGFSWDWAVEMDDVHDPVNRRGGWAERDYGARWEDLAGELQISPKGRFAWDVVADPRSPGTCYTMDFSTVFKTEDAGASWSQLVTELHPDGSVSSRGIDVNGVYDVVTDPFDASHLAFPMTDAGLFHSRDGGRTFFHDLSGVPRQWINSCYALVFDPEVRGRAWSAWSAMHDIPRPKMHSAERLGTDRGGICRSEDGLKTWSPCASGMDPLARCTHLTIDPRSPVGSRRLYAAAFGRGVFRSEDDGRRWVASNEGIDPRNLLAWRLAMAPDGGLYLVVSRSFVRGREAPGALYRSTDGARSWCSLSLPGGVDYPHDLTCDPSGRLYLAAWPHATGGRNAGGGAYASDDGGRTWERMLDDAWRIYTVTVDPRDKDVLYAATFDAAVLRSADRGSSWRRLEGFNFQWAYRPVPDPRDPSALYVTTFGSSVWHGPARGVEGSVEDLVPWHPWEGRGSERPGR